MLPISIVVLSHNRIDEIKKNIPILIDLLQEIELIIVDNASIDGSKDFLKEIALKNKTIKLVLNDKNTGVALGRNAGFKLVSREFVLCLDDDSRMSNDDIIKIPDLFNRHESAGILAFKVRHALTGENQNDHGDQPVVVANFHGAGHAIKRNVFNEIGFLDELCTFGGEEFDFSVRAHAAGYETIYIPSAIVHHNSFYRAGKVGSDRVLTWGYNYCRVLLKNFPISRGLLFSIRYVFDLARYGFSTYGAIFLFKLFLSSISGVYSGIKVHRCVPVRTVLFYSNPKLCPLHGNVPLRLGQRILRKLGKIIS
jgi:GT2 family glycosyltransferase